MRFLLPTPARRRAAAHAAVRALARAAGTAVFAVTLAACSFITGVPDVSRVDLTVPVTVIAPGEQVQATGLAIGNGGNVVDHPRRRVSFSSSNDSVATVTANGVIRGISPGRVTITASSDGKSDREEITVRPIPVRQVLISRRVLTVRLVPGVAYIIDAAVLDTNNQILGNRPPTWQSLDPDVATINQVGAITARTLGTVRITASVDTGLAPKVGVVADTVSLRVTPTPVIDVRITPTSPTLYTGQKLTFVATVTDSLQTTVTRRVVWSTGDRGTSLAIDSLTGEATAVAPSSFGTTVTASVETVPGFAALGNRTGTVSVQVLAPVTSVRVTNNVGTPVTALTLRTGGTVGVTFAALDARGNPLSGRRYRVTSDNEAVARADATGLVTAGASTGTATITVQALDAADAAQGTAATFTVTVTP